MPQAKTKKKRHVAHRAKRLPRGANGGTEILLIQSVDHLGGQGDVVEVRAGYARNYLLPKGFAEKATPNALKQVESLKKKLEEHKAEERIKLKDMFKKIAERESFTVTSEADENGHLYGSVTELMIADMLKEEGFELDKKNVVIEEPIKTTRSICPYCGVGCSVDIMTKGDTLVGVRPAMDGPANEGALCVKGQFAYDWVQHDDRSVDAEYSGRYRICARRDL